VFCRGHLSGAHGIGMQIVELLPHDVVVEDRLRMEALLPHLMLAVGLVPLAVELQFGDQPCPAFFRQLFQQQLRRVLFEIGDGAAEVRPIDDRMKVMIHNHPAV
jgi:hypothetical protein